MVLLSVSKKKINKPLFVLLAETSSNDVYKSVISGITSDQNPSR